GPGLRWALMGPCLTFHLAGGAGGMAHMLDHFGAALLEPWTRLQAPPLTPELRERLVQGCLREARGRSVAELVGLRAKFLAVLNCLVALYADDLDPSREPPGHLRGQPVAASVTGSDHGSQRGGRRRLCMKDLSVSGRTDDDGRGRPVMGRVTTPYEGSGARPWRGGDIPAPPRLHQGTGAAAWGGYNGHPTQSADPPTLAPTPPPFFPLL